MFKVSWPYALLSGCYVGKSLWLFIYCYHGDGSDGRHVCTQYHGHTHYYQATMLEIVRLFVVVTMAMVVMGGMCVQSIMAVRTINVPETICCCHLLLPWRW